MLTHTWNDIVEPVETSDLLRDIQGLPTSACLLRSNDYELWLADAASIPSILQEIGRLREAAFRNVGEGTGNGVDLDTFDQYYRHLFLWHVGREAIIGAYRLGFSEDFYISRGREGFYSWQLFDYSEELVDRLRPCIELGRSFVRIEDQRSFLPLLMLWRGIAMVVSQQPHYRKLFGPVSISASMPPLFRPLLAESLLKFHGHTELSTLVTPRRPLTRTVFAPDVLAGLADATSLEGFLGRLVPGMHMPVLLRRYLNLNGRLLSFSVDPAFNNALDGLVLVDLDHVDTQTLSRFMGAEATREYLNMKGAHHEVTSASKPCAA